MNATSCQEILDAMARHEICGYYQPKYDATTGKLAGAEILARWIKPDGSLLLPQFFVPVLETSESINTLDPDFNQFFPIPYPGSGFLCAIFRAAPKIRD